MEEADDEEVRAGTEGVRGTGKMQKRFPRQTSRQAQAASEEPQSQALVGRGKDWDEGSTFEVLALLKILRARLVVDGLSRVCQFELV